MLRIIAILILSAFVVLPSLGAQDFAAKARTLRAAQIESALSR